MVDFPGSYSSYVALPECSYHVITRWLLDDETGGSNLHSTDDFVAFQGSLILFDVIETKLYPTKDIQKNHQK